MPRLLLLLLLSTTLFARQNAPATEISDDYSGMYTFLQEGEFVEITIEDANRVTGFVSRYDDSGSDRPDFVNQFFKQSKLEGKKFTFTTATVQSVWYDFTGAFDRGPGQNPSDDAYYILKGTLTEHRIGPDKKDSAKSHDVTFKSFPQNSDTAPPN